MDLKQRLEEMDLKGTKEVNVSASQNTATYQTVEERTFPIFGKKVNRDIVVETGYKSRDIEKLTYESEHVSIPYEGKSGASSTRDLRNRPLTELAEKSLKDKEALETFKEKGKEVIDHAVDVFFKSEREFKEGRNAVNELSDLLSGLKTFTGARDTYGSGMTDAAGKLHDALGLYTCVALAPGPMSATVKNLPKISIRSYSSESGGSHGKTEKLLSTTESSSSSFKESRFSYDITTTDERVMPAIMDVRSALDRMKAREGNDGTNSVYIQ